eukprot:m.624170 g.624170  ORF g.624170 m.624170 type:complete len:225 (-) comp58230_c0_seq2:127-801(-)
MAQQQAPYDFLAKLSLVGDSGVGKRSIMRCFGGEPFQPHEFTTIGVDFMSKILQIRDKHLKFQVWDSTGSRRERFRAITLSFYRNAIAVVLVYDVNIPASFEWLHKEIPRMTANALPGAVFVVVGNKCDEFPINSKQSSDSPLSQHAVPTAAGEALAESLGGLFFEVSAKTGRNVDAVFEAIGEQIISKRLFDAHPVLYSRQNPLSPYHQARVEAKKTSWCLLQ